MHSSFFSISPSTGWRKLSLSGEFECHVLLLCTMPLKAVQLTCCSFFLQQYPKLVAPSYAIAFGYCLADAASSGYQIMSEDKEKTVKETRTKEMRAAIAGFDTLLWQGECKTMIGSNNEYNTKGICHHCIKTFHFAQA